MSDGDRPRGPTRRLNRMLAELGREVEAVVLDVAGAGITPMTGALHGRAMPRITRTLGTVYPVRRGAMSALEDLILTASAAEWDRVLVVESERLAARLDERLRAAILAGDDELADLLRMSTMAPERRLAIARGLDDTRTWVDPNGYRLSDRTWNSQRDVRRRIDQQLRLAIVRGTDPRTVAKTLGAYLTPVARRVGPGGQAGRGTYGARRLVRTELARAQAQATVEVASRIPTTRGMTWKLSNNHPVQDRCDLHATADRYGLGAGVYPLDRLPRLPDHPHCRCGWQASLPSREESDRLLRARYGLG